MKLKFFIVTMISILSVVAATKKTQKKNAFFPKTFKAEYEEAIKSSISGRLKKSKGTIEYAHPKKVRIDKKDEFTFVSNGKVAWRYNPPIIEGEKGVVHLANAKSYSLGTFLGLLHKGLKTNEHYTVKKDKKSQYILVFSEVVKGQTELKEAKLKFLDIDSPRFDDLKHAMLTFSDGRKVGIRFSKLQMNVKFKKNYFTFTVPPNTNVIRQ